MKISVYRLNSQGLLIRKAFTLAEVLITLAIIGVVAAMVVPALINNSNNSEYHAAIRKTQADLSQAVKMLKISNGVELLKKYTDYSDNNLINAIASKMNVSKTCINGGTVGSCWSPNNPSIMTDGGGVGANPAPYNGFILSSGIFVSIIGDAAGVGAIPVAQDSTNSATTNSALIAVDVNGFKTPNKVGTDIYFLALGTDDVMRVPTANWILIDPATGGAPSINNPKTNYTTSSANFSTFPELYNWAYNR